MTKWLLRFVLAAVIAYLALAAGVTAAMLQPPSRFGQIMRYVPAPSTTPTTIPAPGLPFSLVFRCEPGKEDVILTIASAYEAASRRRIPPPAFGPLAQR